MGHNKGWEEAASVLSGIPVELETANAAVLEASGDSWQEVSGTDRFRDVMPIVLCLADGLSFVS